MSIVELSVHMDCAGCETKIMKALQKLQGVDDIDIDIRMQKVTVMGWADQKKVLKAVRKTGRRAELWPYPYNPEYDNHHKYNNYNQQYQPQYNRQQSQRYEAVSRQHSQSETYVPVYGQSQFSSSSYNYRHHGYDGHDHGYYQQPLYSTILNDRATDLFSDENPHACFIM
ncbi:hypothetical protein ACFE04_012278 [Oxalis oulophora]